jgi:phosphoribosyl-AMP cyclohydrolase
MSEAWLDSIKWDANGLVPAIAQETGTGTILMMAWMNRESLALTRETGHAVYWSRSRNRLWHKGEESGHQQVVHAIRIDCDADVVLIEVEQKGGIACHTGRHNCFFRELDGSGKWAEVAPVLKDPNAIYSK